MVQDGHGLPPGALEALNQALSSHSREEVVAAATQAIPEAQQAIVADKILAGQVPMRVLIVIHRNVLDRVLWAISDSRPPCCEPHARSAPPNARGFMLPSVP